MRHKYSGRSLNRDASSRKAMFRNMAVSLIEHECIQTTLPKAKELRRFAEPLITTAKKDTVANRRRAFSKLRDKTAVSKLFGDLGVRFESRPGGYLRILKAGFRQSDSAPMAWVILMDRNVDDSQQSNNDKETAAIDSSANVEDAEHKAAIAEEENTASVEKVDKEEK